MTALDLLTRLAPLIPAAIEAEYQRYDCCILAARLAIEVGRYFHIAAAPVPVQVMVLNATFAAHVKEGDCDVRALAAVDDSHSVGIGFNGGETPGRWNGHLVVVAGEYFADFAIGQAERPHKGLITGRALVGAIRADQDAWYIIHESGTVIQYWRAGDHAYRRAPDWLDAKRRRKLAGPIIRAVKESL